MSGLDLSRRRRGAGKVATGHAEAFVERGPELVRDESVVEVSLTGAREHIDRLIGSAAFRGLEAITLRGLDDAAARRLGSTAIPGLRELALPEGELTAGGVAALFSSGLAAQLERLDLAENPLDDAGAAAIARVSFPALVQLRLYECRIGSPGAADLGRASLPSLRELDLGNRPRPTATARSNVIGPSGCQALAGAAWIRRVEVLRLCGNHVEDDGARALAAVPIALQDADLCFNSIGPEGARSLSNAPWSELRRIGLTGNRLLHDTETIEVYDFHDSHLGTEKRELGADEIAARFGFADVY